LRCRFTRSAGAGITRAALELASCLALVALLVLIVVLKSVMRIPDLEGIDD
jgi:hypothetical protein